ncbi:MAG: LytTR family DNA-binding domain-containing protein [Bacteroidota bacterium]
MMISCIIVDDEYPARVLLEQYVVKVPHLQLKGLFKDSLEALEFMRSETVDLILLDIQMPQLTGIQFIKTLQYPPKIIFTTAYADYALESYDLSASDYLLKPIAFERFLEAINKITQQLKLEREAESDDTTQRYIVIKADHRTHRITYEDILYIEGMKEYVRFHTNDNKITTLESLKNLEQTLPENQFYRVHKSFIVNKDKVKSLYGNQLEIAGTMVPIGQSYKDEVLKQLF